MDTYDIDCIEQFVVVLWDEERQLFWTDCLKEC